MSSETAKTDLALQTDTEQFLSERVSYVVDQIVLRGWTPVVGGPWAGKRELATHLIGRYEDVGEFEAVALIDAAVARLVVPGNDKETERILMIRRLKMLSNQLRGMIEKPEVVRKYRIQPQVDAQGNPVLDANNSPVLVRIPVEEKEFSRLNDRAVRSIIEIEEQIAVLHQFDRDDSSSEETARLFEQIEKGGESQTRVISVVQKQLRKPIEGTGENARSIVQRALDEMRLKGVKQLPEKIDGSEPADAE